MSPIMAEAKIELTVCYSIILYVGLIGNIIVMKAIGSQKRRGKDDIYVMGLAFADICRTVFGLVKFGLKTFGDREVTSLAYFADFTPLLATAWLLVVMLIIQYRSITVPEKRKGTTTAKQFVMVVIVYMASLLLVFPLVLLGLDAARIGIPFKWLSIPYFCYAWLVPFVSFTVMVFVVFMKLRKGISGRVIGGEESDNMLREKKATKNSVMITTIIAFQFFLLTFPYQLVHFLPLKLQVISWVECVSYLNGCIKPVIIALTFRSIKNEEPLRGETSHRNVRKGFEPFTNETFAGDDFAETKH